MVGWMDVRQMIGWRDEWMVVWLDRVLDGRMVG